MQIGAHVSSSGSLVASLGRGAAIGAEVIQIFTQSPRMWRAPRHSAEDLAAYHEAEQAHESVSATFCHATYLINLAAGDEALADKSRRCLVENLDAATGIGARGLVLHIGSHRGVGLDKTLAQITGFLLAALDEVAAAYGRRPCPILLENAAGAGGTVGRSFEELATVLSGCGDDDRLGICLDTQHLFASGIDFRSIEGADETIAVLDSTVGLERLQCIHLNDSKVALGANRDRHENLGDGEIGSDGLGSLLSHPLLGAVPALLEVPGAGEGPRQQDVEVARTILAEGLERRRKAKR